MNHLLLDRSLEIFNINSNIHCRPTPLQTYHSRRFGCLYNAYRPSIRLKSLSVGSVYIENKVGWKLMWLCQFFSLQSYQNVRKLRQRFPCIVQTAKPTTVVGLQGSRSAVYVFMSHTAFHRHSNSDISPLGILPVQS